MSSLWLDRAREDYDDPLPADGRYDDLVVGAGLTGLTVGLLLARAGRRVGVVEARHVGAVTSGHTTAKLSLLQGTRLCTIAERTSLRVAEAYVDANREGKDWLLRFCEDHDVAVQRRVAVTYAAQPAELPAVRQEHAVASELGLDVRWTDTLDVAFPHHGAVELADQAQFDPLDILHAMVEELRSHGGSVHEGRRVVDVSLAEPRRVTFQDRHVLVAENVVLATGTPILDRGLYFAKVEPKRSYLLAFEGAEAPTGMYISAGASVRSVRDVPLAGGRSVLLVGGNGHTVGRTDSERRHLDELREWAARYFPGAAETHAWSAQDYASHDGIPFVGRMSRGGGHIYIATGYDKWGMTNAVAAARSISAQILGRSPSWATVLGRRVTGPAGALRVAEINALVGVAAARSLAAAEAHPAPATVPDGDGQVGRANLIPTGVSSTDGVTCRVIALCTHLGGTLRWNDAESSWDCPLHGSRFSATGAVLEGPATRPLRQVRPTSG